MTTDRTVPDDSTFTVDQLTRDDLTALAAFVDARLDELTARGETGAVGVLREALGYHLEVLRLSFQWEDDYGTPPPPQELAQRERTWNVLVGAVWIGWHTSTATTRAAGRWFTRPGRTRRTPRGSGEHRGAKASASGLPSGPAAAEQAALFQQWAARHGVEVLTAFG